MDKINILLVTDHNYIMPTGVLMHSIGTNNPSDISFHIILSSELSEDDKKSLKDIANKYNENICFYNFNIDSISSFPVGRNDQPQHITLPAYYRLFAAEILPNSMDKIIYMDGDTIVRKSLRPLWNIDMTKNSVGVVNDQNDQRHISSKRLSYDMTKGFFNSGMLVINLKYWREHEMAKQFVDYVVKFQEEVVWHDQDVLNVVCADSKKTLPITYNFQDAFLLRPEFLECTTEVLPQIEQYINDPTIQHFTMVKPWDINCFQPQCASWRHYWRKSKWKDQKLRGEDANTVKEWIRNKALRHCWFIPKSKFRRIILRK